MSSIDGISIGSLDSSGMSESLFSDAGFSEHEVAESVKVIGDLTAEVSSRCKAKTSPTGMVRTFKHAATQVGRATQVFQAVIREKEFRKSADALTDASRKSPTADPTQNRSFRALVDLPVISHADASKKAKILHLEDSLRLATCVQKAAEPLLFAEQAETAPPECSYEYAQAVLDNPDEPLIERGKLLGRGATSNVYSAKLCGREVAMKSMTRSDDYTKELRLMQTFDHQNILSCHMATEKTIFTDFAPNGDFEGLTDSPGLTTEVFRNLVSGAAEGVAHMHDMGYVHRDLKPLNILVGDEEALVADLETAIPVTEFKPHSRGTYYFMAPEVIRGEVDRESEDEIKTTDTYTFGITLFRLLKKAEIYSPYVSEYAPQGKFNSMGVMAMTIGDFDKELDAEHLMPLLDQEKLRQLDPTGEVTRVMIDCLRRDPAARPQMSEVAERLALYED